MTSVGYVFAELIDTLIRRTIPRFVEIRSVIAELILESSTTTFIGLLSRLRSAEASHIEDLEVKLGGKLMELVSILASLAKESLELQDVANAFDELVSLGIPPAIATELLFALNPSKAPLIDDLATTGARNLGLEIYVPRNRSEYLAMVQTLDGFANELEPLRRAFLGYVPKYLVVDTILQLAYENRIDRCRLEELHRLGTTIEALRNLRFLDA